MKKLVALAGCLFLMALPSQAYYHFIHYLTSGNAPEKFDLRALPGKTVTFLVSGGGPAVYAKTDSFNSVLNQLQQATAIWNGVASSDLRVAFGGFEEAATLQNAPGGDVVFEDLPPGVLGFGGPTSRADVTVAADGTRFFPILRSVVHLNRNLTLTPGPSYNQSFLLTTVHEMGHALGLQHTFTASAMSQDTIRATTLARPVDNDDVAGISALYPAASFRQTGTITGRITSGDKGVHLASVVAIRSGAGAVSALTNPDGTYRMDGVPPGQYSVYVHSLPPDANIFGPWDADGNVTAASGAVNSVFYPGTTDFNQATPVVVVAGAAVGGIDMSVTARASVPVYDGQIFGYLNSNTVSNRPAPVLISGLTTPVAASVTGLGSNGKSAGLSVQFPGNAVSLVPNGIVPSLSNGFTYVFLYLKIAPDAQPGPQHVIFNTPDYMYVLPSAMYLTASVPPALTGLTANADGTITVTGNSFLPGTQIYFESLPATLLSLDSAAGIAVVLPPSGTNGQQATLTAYNPDGQNSQLWKPATPLTYAYGKVAAPSIIAIYPSALPAGAEGAIDILGADSAFAQGLTSVGFGSGDIFVRRVTVLSPTHLRANISVSSNAALSSPNITITSGFGIATAPGQFQISATAANLPVAVPVLVNASAESGVTGVFPGATVSLYGRNLVQQVLTQQNLTTPRVTIGGHQALLFFWSPTQINLQIPSDLTPGPAVLVVNNGVLNSYAVDVVIDPLPAGFAAVQLATGEYITPTRAARIGDTLIATMIGFAPAGSIITPAHIQVSLGGVAISASKVEATGTLWQVTFTVPALVPVGAAQRLIVYRDGLSSVLASIPVVAADIPLVP